MKKLIKLGIGFGVGSTVVAKLGQQAPPNRAGNINSAMEIGSLAMPIYATKKVMKSTKKLL